MKKNKLLLAITIVSFSLSTTGCGEAVISMTPEEEQLVVLYAAKTISKFNKNQTNGICNVRYREDELAWIEGKTTEEQIPEADSFDDSVDISTDIVSNSVDEDSLDDTNSNNFGLSLDDAFGIEGMKFTCTSFDVTKEFQANTSFVLTEVSGKSYLVLKIDGTNTTDNDIDFSTIDKKSYRLIINGSDRSDTQLSFIDNDLTSFSSVVKADTTEEFILVFQFRDDALANINSLKLEINNNGEIRGTTIEIM